MSDTELRKQLVDLLTKEYAHIDLSDAVADIPADDRGRRIDGQPYTIWELLEHLRIAQWDILEFSRNPSHRSPSFPDGYWPDTETPSDESSWEKSIAGFQQDLEEFCDLLRDDSNDLNKPFAHGNGQTLLREAFVLARHNSYHLGQVVALKKLLAENSQV